MTRIVVLASSIVRAYGDGDSKPVTLTATASYNGGEKVTKTIEVTVKEKTRIAPDTGYAARHF